MKKMENIAERGRAFQVTITEVYQRTVTVYENELKEATKAEAEKTVEDWWQDSQIELTEEDFQGVEFHATEAAPTENKEGGDGYEPIQF